MADLNVRLKIRADSKANWESNNPVLLEHELGIELGDTPDKNKVKLGDGTTAWNSLAYMYDLESIVAKIPQGGKLYTLTKTTLEQADSELLATVKDSAHNGDVAVITTTVDDVTYEVSSYIYDGEKGDYVAITGQVDADKVILREDITMAGNYTAVGNLSKTQTGTATFATKGKSVMDALTEIFSKRLQPTKTEPSVSGFTLSGAKAVEAGTKIIEASFSGAKLNPGSYTYGPATGVTATTYKVDRVCTPGALSKENVGDAASGADNNEGAGFVIGDQTGDNVCSSLAYKVTISYNEGAVAKDNLGGNSEPEVKIAAGNKSQTTSAYTPYRNYFYGAVSDEEPKVGGNIDSELVRKLTASNKAYAAGNITLQVPAGSTGVYIACINGKNGVTKVINQTSLNADVTATFVKQTGIQVEGADGYDAVAYNVWHFIPDIAYENAATLIVTLG